MRLFIVIILFLQSFSSIAQSDVKSIVASDIKLGNISDLSSYFTDNIDISIDEIDAIYSRSQAAMILKKFFTDNEVSDYKTEHAGNSSKDNQYIIGKMETKNGIYRVTYFITMIDDMPKIKQFNIESY